MRGFTRKQKNREKLPEKGAWTGRRFNRRLSKKGVVFLREVIPQCTLWIQKTGT